MPVARPREAEGPPALPARPGTPRRRPVRRLPQALQCASVPTGPCCRCQHISSACSPHTVRWTGVRSPASDLARNPDPSSIPACGHPTARRCACPRRRGPLAPRRSSVTLRVYAHMIRDQVAAAADILARSIRPMTTGDEAGPPRTVLNGRELQPLAAAGHGPARQPPPAQHQQRRHRVPGLVDAAARDR